MPMLVAAAVAYAATAAAVAANLIVAGTLGAAVFSTVVTLVASAVVNKAFSDGGDSDGGGQQFEQELNGNLLTVRQPIMHWQWIYGQTRVGGAITYIETTTDIGVDNRNALLHLVITFAGHECEEIGSIYFDDELIPLDGTMPNGGGNATGRLAGYCSIEKSLGNETGQPFPNLVAYSAGLWTDAHRQSGRTKIHVALRYSPDKFPNGIPNITAVIKGKKVYDPRSTLTAWSINPSLCIADFLCSPVWLGCDYATEIDEAQLIAAANIDDEQVAVAAGGTENRYMLDGVFSVNRDSRSVLERMLTANAGKLHYIGGLFRIQPAAYVSPTITLDEDDLRGVPQIQPRLSATDLCNAVKGVYVSEANKWQPSDFPPVTNATYLAEDEGERSWRELDLAFTKSAAGAQRIAKIELERVRQQISLVWPGKFTCYRLQPGDTVQVTFAMLGWSAKVFEVVGSTLAIEDDGNGGVRLGCDLALRETASSVFDWSSGEETTVDPAPDTNLPNPLSVEAPGAPTVVESKLETRDGRGVAALVTVSVAAPADPFWKHIQFEYQVVGASLWTVIPPSEALTVSVPDVQPEIYDFRAKVINNLGVSSDYATTRQEIVGLYDRPATPVIRGLQTVGGIAILTLDPAADLDVRRGGRWRVRHCEDDTDPPWEESFSIGEEQGYVGDQTVLVLPLKAGAYLVRAEDAVGQQSEEAAYIATKQASVLAYSPVDTLTESTSFPGSHDNTVAVDGILKLSGTGLFDDIPDFDAISSLDDYGGVTAAGTYTFSAGLDFGAVERVRVTGHIEGITVNVNDLFDDREGDIDDWLDFDGTAGGGSCDAWLECRETDDDPAGTPTWSEWKRLDASEFECRAMQFRLRITSNDPAYNLVVDTLSVAAEEVT